MKNGSEWSVSFPGLPTVRERGFGRAGGAVQDRVRNAMWNWNVLTLFCGGDVVQNYRSPRREVIDLTYC
jgi:hypothetical protein